MSSDTTARQQQGTAGEGDALLATLAVPHAAIGAPQPGRVTSPGASQPSVQLHHVSHHAPPHMANGPAASGASSAPAVRATPQPVSSNLRTHHLSGMRSSSHGQQPTGPGLMPSPNRLPALHVGVGSLPFSPPPASTPVTAGAGDQGGLSLAQGASGGVKEEEIELLSLEALISDPPEVRDARERCGLMAAYRADDFDAADSDLQRELLLATTKRQYALEQASAWVISAASGVVNGCFGAGFNLCITALTDAKFNTVQKFVQPGGGWAKPYLVLLAFSILYAAVAGFMGCFFSPQAAGSGIPEIRAYLNGVHIKGLLSIRTLVAKTIGVSFTIASGLVAGKEGPFIHVGAIVGGGVAQLGSQSLTRWTRGKLRAQLRRDLNGYFRHPVDHRDYVAAGSAAGVSTAFAAPIAGILFAVEQGSSWFSTKMLWHAVVAAGVGLYVALVIANADSSRSSLWRTPIGSPQAFVLNYGGQTPKFYWATWEVLVFMAMGVLGGLLGALLVVLNNAVTRFRVAVVPRNKPFRRMLEVVLLSAFTASIWFSVAYSGPCTALPSGIDRSKDAWVESMWPQLWCEDPRTYSGWGMFFLAPISTSTGKLFFQYDDAGGQTVLYDLAGMAMLFVFTYILISTSFGMGAAAGVFVPTLMSGAAFGRLVGRLVRAALLSASSGSSTYAVSLPTYAVVGSAALLGGFSRMLLSSSVLIMETAGADQLVVPLILTSLVAKLVADALCTGLYDVSMARSAFPFMPPEPRDLHHAKLCQHLSVADAMSPNPVTMPCVVRIRDLVTFLRTHRFSTIPLHAPEPYLAPAASDSRHTAYSMRLTGSGRIVGSSATSGVAQAVAPSPTMDAMGLLRADIQPSGRKLTTQSMPPEQLVPKSTSVGRKATGADPPARTPLGAVSVAGSAANGATPAAHTPHNQAQLHHVATAPGLVVGKPPLPPAPEPSSHRPWRKAVSMRDTTRHTAPIVPSVKDGDAGIPLHLVVPQQEDQQQARVLSPAAAEQYDTAVHSPYPMHSAAQVKGASVSQHQGQGAGPAGGSTIHNSTYGEGHDEAGSEAPGVEGPRNPVLVGVMSRQTLLKILQSRAGFFASLKDASVQPGGGVRVSATRLRSAMRALEALPLKPPTTQQGEEEVFSSLTETELSCFLNLRHYMQRVPLAIPATASLSRAYTLFRTMGLHHLMVTAGDVPIVGVLTRSDLVPDRAEVLMHEKLSSMLMAAATAPNGELPHFPATAPSEASHSTHMALERATSPAVPYQPPRRSSMAAGGAGLRQRTRIGTMSVPGQRPAVRTSAFQAGGAAAAAVEASMSAHQHSSAHGQGAQPASAMLTPRISLDLLRAGPAGDARAIQAAESLGTAPGLTAGPPSRASANGPAVLEGERATGTQGVQAAVEAGLEKVVGVLGELLRGPPVPPLEGMPEDAALEAAAAMQAHAAHAQCDHPHHPDADGSGIQHGASAEAEALMGGLPLDRTTPTHDPTRAPSAHEVQFPLPTGGNARVSPHAGMAGLLHVHAPLSPTQHTLTSPQAGAAADASSRDASSAAHLSVIVSPAAGTRSTQLAALQHTLRALVTGAGADEQVDAMLRGTYDPDVPTELDLLAYEAQALGMHVVPLGTHSGAGAGAEAVAGAGAAGDAGAWEGLHPSLPDLQHLSPALPRAASPTGVPLHPALSASPSAPTYAQLEAAMDAVVEGAQAAGGTPRTSTSGQVGVADEAETQAGSSAQDPVNLVLPTSGTPAASANTGRLASTAAAPHRVLPHIFSGQELSFADGLAPGELAQQQQRMREQHRDGGA